MSRQGICVLREMLGWTVVWTQTRWFKLTQKNTPDSVHRNASMGHMFGGFIILTVVAFVVTNEINENSFPTSRGFKILTGIYVPGDVIEEVDVVVEAICAVICSNNPSCSFANYNSIRKHCQVMKGSLGDLQDSKEWNVFIADNNNMGQNCELHSPCAVGQLCREGWTADHKPSMICLKNRNVARQAIPRQSSNLNDPYFAIDGNLKTLSHTRGGGEQWLKIDLKFIFFIHKIEIYNKTNYYRYRLGGYLLKSSQSGTTYTTLATLKGVNQQAFTLNLHLRFVLIIKHKNPDVLHLAEVKILTV